MHALADIDRIIIELYSQMTVVLHTILLLVHKLVWICFHVEQVLNGIEYLLPNAW